MSYCDVYIGDLDDPNFEMECTSDEKWNIGNCPKSMSPLFPEGSRAFDELINRIENGQLKGKKVDWGAWVAPASKKQIIDFIEYLYDEKWQERYKSFPHLLEQLFELKKVVLKFDDEKLYGLTASEL
jgi:hypothetical protein